MPAGEDRKLAFDYLIDLVSEPIPVPVWLAIVDWCNPEQALGVGHAARLMARFEAAEAAFGKAAGADVPGAKAALAEVIGSGGEPGRAVALVTEALAGMPVDDTETLQLRSMLARFTQKIDEPELARRMFAELLDDCQESLGPDHPETLEVGLQAAVQLGESRSHSEAVQGLAELIDKHGQVYGPDHSKTLKARFLHAIWTGRQGDRARAVELFAEQLADRIRVQGPDHPGVTTWLQSSSSWCTPNGRNGLARTAPRRGGSAT